MNKTQCNSYLKGKDFVNILARIANFTTNGSHGAFMLFSDPETTKKRNEALGLDSRKNLIEFSEKFDTNKFTKVVNDTIQGIIEDNTLCKDGLTQIHMALVDSLSNMFQKSKGMREYAEQVAVLITDGEETGDDDPTLQNYIETAERFKQRKIKVLAIGVGNVNDEFLNILVQSPQHFFKVDTFDNLVDNLTDMIGAIICKGM